MVCSKNSHTKTDASFPEQEVTPFPEQEVTPFPEQEVTPFTEQEVTQFPKQEVTPFQSDAISGTVAVAEVARAVGASPPPPC